LQYNIKRSQRNNFELKGSAKKVTNIAREAKQLSNKASNITCNKNSDVISHANGKESNTSFKSNIEYITVNDDISKSLSSSKSPISSETKSKKAENTNSKKGYMHDNPLDSQDSISTVISANSGDMKQTKSSIINRNDEKSILIESKKVVN